MQICGKRLLTNQGWNLRGHSVDLELDADRVVALGLAINELVTNAAKHAFAYRERGIIGVRLSSANGDLLLNVSNDGTGIDENVRTDSGLGQKFARSFVDQVQGKRVIESRSSGTSRVRFLRQQAGWPARVRNLEDAA